MAITLWFLCSKPLATGSTVLRIFTQLSRAMEAVENYIKYIKDHLLQWNPREYIIKIFSGTENVGTAPKNPMTP
jgi:hypothetical protein